MSSNFAEIIPTNTCPPNMIELTRRSEAFSTFATKIHLDICDDIFAPVLSWPYHDTQWVELQKMATDRQLLPYADAIFYETHLMVQDPLRIGELLARVGVRRILAHTEVFGDTQSIRSAFTIWKSAGASEVGLALLIDTPLSVLDPVIEDIDVVLLMSIPTLGKQGAPFDERIFARIEELHALHPELLIAVDGGVSDTNIADLVRAGARRFGVGSAMSRAPDPSVTYQQLLKKAQCAVQ